MIVLLETSYDYQNITALAAIILIVLAAVFRGIPWCAKTATALVAGVKQFCESSVNKLTASIDAIGGKFDALRSDMKAIEDQHGHKIDQLAGQVKRIEDKVDEALAKK